MLKSLLSLVVTLGFVASANAMTKEIQINGSHLGTEAAVEMDDDGTTDGTDYGFGLQVYFGLSEQLQVGGLLAYADGDSFADAAMMLGGLVRYNLSSELRDAVFVEGGVRYADYGAADQISILLGVGKRYALSDTITWTPNVSVALHMAGDLDEGHNIALNLLSFSGFMD